MSVGAMGESRQELLLWLNDLLQLGYTKVEQCGSGAAHCQIMDSIYRNVPVSKVKFNAKHEYEYVQNYKVLQAIFDKNKIQNAIPVERLIKCKFQDNLEFLQWVKKYWDQYYPGGTYDAISRRKGQQTPSTTGNVRKANSNNSISKSNGSINNGTTKVMPSAVARPKPDFGSQKELDKQIQENAELRLSMEQVEKEREFYFGKLREIELYVQKCTDDALPADTPINEVLQAIAGIMYKTEDGFEVPDKVLDGQGEEEVEPEMF